MKTFALALLASSTLAWNRQGTTQWVRQPVQQSWQPVQQSWQPATQTQSWRPATQAPMPQQPWQPAQQSWKPATQAPMPQQPTKVMKQFVPQPVVATWQQQTQQPMMMAPPTPVPHSAYHGSHDAFRYSQPQIPYVPAKLSEAFYAECYFAITNMRLLFGQLPGHPIEMRGEIDGGDGEYFGKKEFTLKTYGVYDPESRAEEGVEPQCPEMEPTYNPIANKNHLETDEHGAISDVIIPDTYSIPYEFEFDKPLLQNLGTGHDSIIGRGVTSKVEYENDEAASVILLDCCPIVMTAPPPPDPSVPSYQPHFHPAPHYAFGHGSAGGHKKVYQPVPAQPQPMYSHNRW